MGIQPPSSSPAAAACAALLLAAGGSAQNHFTSPPGRAASEGASAAATSQPFHNPSGRYQYVDGDQRGTARPALQALELRRDGLAPMGNFGPRSTVVTLVMAHADLARVGTTFAANYKDAPVTVFARKTVQLPDHAAPPAVTPAPWTVAFPFDVPFSYNGTDDLLWEVRAEQTTPAGPFSLDAEDGWPLGRGLLRYLGVPCTTPNGRFDAFGVAPETAADGTVTLRTHARGAPGGAPAVLTLGTVDPGIGGLFCTVLHTNVEIALPVPVGAGGAIGSAEQPLRLAFPFFGRVEVFGQYAAFDAGQAGLPYALSDGMGMYVVEASFGTRVVRVVEPRDANASVGARSEILVPVARLRY
ncbi:MAG: hypothetical protein IT458_04155 [Planctomycetes bacterium]|nr:hypothetical protein [Planctomycetota bacterium]